MLVFAPTATEFWSATTSLKSKAFSDVNRVVEDDETIIPKSSTVMVRPATEIVQEQSN